MAIGLQFLFHDTQIADGIISSCIDNVNQEPGALDVT